MPVVVDDLYATVFKISQGDLGLFKKSTDDLLEIATGSKAEGLVDYTHEEAQVIQTNISDSLKDLSDSSAVSRSL